MKLFRQENIKTLVSSLMLIFLFFEISQLRAPIFNEPKGVRYYDGLITNAIIEIRGKVSSLIHNFAKTGDRRFLDSAVQTVWKGNKVGIVCMTKLVDECAGKYNIATLEQAYLLEKAWKAGEIASLKVYEKFIADIPNKLFQKAYNLVITIERCISNQVYIIVFRTFLRKVVRNGQVSKILTDLDSLEKANLLGENCAFVRDLRPRVIAAIQE